eukprot:6172825-Pleurochrysis_carterae.AAC.3
MGDSERSTRARGRTRRASARERPSGHRQTKESRARGTARVSEHVRVRTSERVPVRERRRMRV